MSRINQAVELGGQKPVVTVIIPCHNHADMVGEAIDSVFCQDYQPLQIAVIDDGSNDNPEKVIQKKINENREVPIYFFRNQTAQGPSAARNKAIAEMFDKTDLFMMLDADDLYLKGKVCKSVEKYLEHPEHIGIVYTDAIIENIQKGTRIHEFRMPFDREELERECIISNTPLISKDALATVGGYDEDMRTCEDWDLWLRITEYFTAVHIPETLHIYHVTGKNSSETVPKEVWASNWEKIRQRILSRRKNVS